MIKALADLGWELFSFYKNEGLKQRVLRHLELWALPFTSRPYIAYFNLWKHI